MKNSADQGGRYPQRSKAEVDNTLRDLHILGKPNSIIALFSNRWWMAARAQCVRI